MPSQCRILLCIATLVAGRHNPPLRNHYERLLANGKLKKVALVAFARKLLTGLKARLKFCFPWQDELVTAYLGDLQERIYRL